MYFCLLTKYENYVGRGIEFLDLRTDANTDALASYIVAVFHRIVPPFTLTSVFADAATHAIQFVPRLACLCALAHAPAIERCEWQADTYALPAVCLVTGHTVTQTSYDR